MVLDGLTWEQQYQEIPEYPTRPMLFDSDLPSGELATMAEARFETERGEREYQLRMALSGSNARGYSRVDGPQSPAERAHERELAEDVRRYVNGLPDSPGDMPPKVGSGKPF